MSTKKCIGRDIPSGEQRMFQRTFASVLGRNLRQSRRTVLVACGGRPKE